MHQAALISSSVRIKFSFSDYILSFPFLIFRCRTEKRPSAGILLLLQILNPPDIPLILVLRAGAAPAESRHDYTRLLHGNVLTVLHLRKRMRAPDIIQHPFLSLPSDVRIVHHTPVPVLWAPALHHGLNNNQSRRFYVAGKFS